MKSISSFLFLAVAACLVCMPTASAQSLENVEGGNVLVPTTVTETPLPDGNILVRAMNEGFTWTMNPDAVLGNGTLDCQGALILSAEGDVLGGGGGCQSIDTDGDVWYITYTDSGMGGGEWHIIGGTGKFEGVTGGGTWKDDADYVDGKQSNTWVGSWTMGSVDDSDDGMQ